VAVREPHDRLRQLVLTRDGHRCLVCGDTRDLQIDHFISWADGGLTIYENLLTLCGACNRQKGALSGEPGLRRAHAAFQRDPFRIFSS
jgi:5-methylcytosine-specific restriction endonuclease McrA